MSEQEEPTGPQSDELKQATTKLGPPDGNYAVAGMRFEFNCALFHVPDGEDASQMFLQNIQGVAPFGMQGWDMVGNPFPIGPGLDSYEGEVQSTILVEPGPKPVVERPGMWWGIMMKRVLVLVPSPINRVQRRLIKP